MDTREFKGFSTQEVENMVIIFYENKLFYPTNQEVSALFYSDDPNYEMKNEDKVSVCSLQTKKPISSVSIQDSQPASLNEVLDITKMQGETYDAKKSTFLLGDSLSVINPNEYYQFVYFTSTGAVLGMSTPFKLGLDSGALSAQSDSRTRSSVDGENKEEEEDFIVVISLLLFVLNQLQHFLSCFLVD